MRPPTVNNNHEINESLTDYSITELQDMAVRQQEQIEQNQQLLLTREQRLKYLNQEQTTEENLRIFQIKNIRIKNLQNEINQEKKSNSLENELEILRKIFLNKEQELTISLNKLDQLTKQLDQLRKLKITANNEQSQNKNQLEKLKQELSIRNNLNEQQSRKIAYQREIYAAKQAEIGQLDGRIEELQQRLKKKKTSSPSNDFRTALNTVQDTLNNINIAEIEKRMLQLAHSFNSINTNSPKQVCSTSKIAFASKSEIAATYMARSLTAASPPLLSMDPSDSTLLPPNLRLNDDKLSVHFNNVASNVKKRHSLCDSNELLTKYLAPSIEQQPIQVRDESLTNSLTSETKSTIVLCENLQDDENEQQDQTIIESFISDTESEGGSLSDDIESAISVSISPPNTNLKSLLKTPTTPKNTSRRVVFNPLALLLDAAVLGELELLIKCAKQVNNPSQPNDEGLTALHNAVCASNFECIKFLVEFGCDINYADNDGWTPLHCAASCNNTLIVKYLIEHGACIYATTTRDNEIAVEKCEEEEENYMSCSKYLLEIQNDFGVVNDGLVYALYDYESDFLVDDELQFKEGDQLIILRRGDEKECQWYWARHETTQKKDTFHGITSDFIHVYDQIQCHRQVVNTLVSFSYLYFNKKK